MVHPLLSPNSLSEEFLVSLTVDSSGRGHREGFKVTLPPHLPFVQKGQLLGALWPQPPLSRQPRCALGLSLNLKSSGPGYGKNAPDPESEAHLTGPLPCRRAPREAALSPLPMTMRWALQTSQQPRQEPIVPQMLPSLWPSRPQALQSHKPLLSLVGGTGGAATPR